MNSLNSDEDLASKCIGLCHALACQNKSFSFSLTVGSNFSFSLDTREMVSDNQTKKAKKKKSSPSPSTIRSPSKASRKEPLPGTLLLFDPLLSHFQRE